MERKGGSIAVSLWEVGIVSEVRVMSINWSSVSICRAQTRMFCKVGWRRAMNLGGGVKCNVE